MIRRIRACLGERAQMLGLVCATTGASYSSAQRSAQSESASSAVVATVA